MGIPGIETVISPLCNRANKKKLEDKTKLKHVPKILKHKINYKRVMGVDNPNQLCKWFDAAYGVHPNLKSHTGSGM